MWRIHARVCLSIIPDSNRVNSAEGLIEFRAVLLKELFLPYTPKIVQPISVGVSEKL